MARRRVANRRRRVRRRMRRSRIRRPIPTGIPQTMTVRMRYVDTISLNPDGVHPANYVFRANSIYDPNYSGIGHQPMWHDMYALMYKRYRVIGSKITARFVNSTANNYLVGVFKSDDPSTLMASEAITENKASKYRYLNASGGGGSTTIVEKFSARSWFRNVTLDTQMATVNANPTQVSYYRLWAEDQFKGDVEPIVCTVTIEYVVKFTEPLIETITN